MNSSTVSFAAAPTLGALGESLGAQFDAAVRHVKASDAVIAAAEALRAREVARVAELADRMAHEDGSAATAAGREWARRKVVTELACATKRSERATNRLIEDSERLVSELPLTLASLESGTISYLHARALIAHASTVPETFRAAFEREVLPHAQAMPAHRFDDRARRLRERLHPESIVMRTRAAVEERHVALLPECDGMATISHHLPAIDALAIDDLLDRTARAARSEADDRTHAQRRCDALTDLVLGRATGARITPTVLITIPASAFNGADDEPATLHGYGPIDAVSAREIARNAPTFLRAALPTNPGSALVIARHRTPAAASRREVDEPSNAPVSEAPASQSSAISATETSCSRAPASATSASALTAASEATLEAAPAGVEPSMPAIGPSEIDTSQALAENRYSASPIVRTALALLDETCRFPGCGRRADRCELDHTQAWSGGGRTTPANLAHLCSRHHHLKHEGGWRVTPFRDGTRALTWTSPRGATYTTTPDNHSLGTGAPDPPTSRSE
jgi:hypothetical protein